jgi:nudix-type nucleoside diphosphatase (YffH/AdpP family)
MRLDLPRVVARRRIFQGWNTLDIATIEAADAEGAVQKYEREIIDHGEAAVVLPVDRGRSVAFLVRQWRAPLVAAGADPFLLEACAGIVDAGETPEETARREAEEEMGFRLRELRRLGAILPSAGTLTERMHLFVAEVVAADRGAPGGGKRQEGETIEVVEIPVAELFGHARAGRLEDAKTLAIVQRLQIEELEAAVSGR